MKEIFNQIVCSPLILLIKVYKYLISPLLGHNCRFLPTCSDYFLESLKKKVFLLAYIQV